MKPGYVVLIVLGGIAVLYLIIVAISLSLFFSFRAWLKRHRKGIEVILNMKLDNLNRVVAIFKTNHIAIPTEVKRRFESIDKNCFKDLTSKECIEARKNLSYIRDELFFVAKNNEHILVNEEFLLAKENIGEQDKDYRKLVAMYNGDVLGYNYWSKFTATRYLFLLFKVKEKEII